MRKERKSEEGKGAAIKKPNSTADFEKGVKGREVSAVLIGLSIGLPLLRKIREAALLFRTIC